MRSDRKRGPAWRGPADGPWPWVSVQGDLTKAEGEWITTNDYGAYASSTVALMHTRRHHALLVVPWQKRGPRYVILSHVETALEVRGRYYQMSTHQFPGVAPTPGYRFLESFHQDPLPRWVFRVAGGTLERTVSLVRGSPAVILSFHWSGPDPARLLLRPLMPMRPEHQLCREYGSVRQEVILRSGEVEVQPDPALPAVRFRHRGVFMGSPDWWRQFEYLDDRGRYLDFREDMWTPGVFEVQLQPQGRTELMAFVGDPPEGDPMRLVLEAAEHRIAEDPGQDSAPAVRLLRIAVDSFRVGAQNEIVAGYPWHDVWTRDHLLALPGIFLAAGRPHEAAIALRTVIQTMEGGLIPERPKGALGSRPCVDASLWAFLVSERVLTALPDGAAKDELARLLLPALRTIHQTIKGGTDFAWLSTEGLLILNGFGPHTWMDAIVEGVPVTPRDGACIEIQALWVEACRLLAKLAAELGDAETSAEATRDTARGTTAFRDSFVLGQWNYPPDRVSEGRDFTSAWVDKSIRPNALIALAVCPALFEATERREILACVEAFLLTPRGIRTLDPRDPNFIASAGGTIADRLRAAHQGSAWPHLLLFYVRAKLHEYPEARDELVTLVSDVLQVGIAFGYVGQMVDGDPPHTWRGSPAYAVANAMLLEALRLELDVP
ncbi:MAG: hypothetical protein B6A08_12900 [Sorangiineae bacterium NIC37A_2]|jgi:predicted glycogen debranching enzyme|nr:MAG: hypothetical protein B6A08_12900 [Sorangiineae bacterium NIC37A_2]